LSHEGIGKKKAGFRFWQEVCNALTEMKATRQLHDLNQRLWLDNITRDLLSSWTVKHHIDGLSVTDPAAAIRIGWQEE
jgi:hypothetical protein